MSRKKILLYQGGRYHSIDKTYNNFQSILKEYIIDNYVTTDIFSKKEFFDYSTMIFFSQEGEFTEDQEKNVLEFIASGKGFIGLHGASASFKKHPKYFEMLGGRFIGHKDLQDFDVKIIDFKHPITNGLNNFSFKDEPYRHDFSMGENIHVLAKADYYDKEDPHLEPIVWIKNYRQGRVFFCSLGHRNISLKDEIFQIIIKRAVEWVIEGSKG